MKTVLVNQGPLTAMFSVLPCFLSYRDGIYRAQKDCALKSTVKHSLLIVGFGKDQGSEYWIVQNSWGQSWGDKGFGKIARGPNTCGIADFVTYPGNIVDPSKEVLRPFQLYLHDPIKTGAQCLDGSPSGLYFSKGFGDGKNKTIFYMLGGGWCTGRNTDEVTQDCYERSFTKLGSTVDWDDTLTWIDKSFPGDPTKDLTYYNWNRVFVIYCDGTGHQGYISQPVNVKGKDIYFKGHNNFNANLNWALTKLPP